VPGRRAFVSEAYPLDDTGQGTIAASTRERLADTAIWLPGQGIEVTGSAEIFTSSRLHRFRRTIPRGATWTHAQGLLVDVQPDGDV
jgi:hypothetical protein